MTTKQKAKVTVETLDIAAKGEEAAKQAGKAGGEAFAKMSESTESAFQAGSQALERNYQEAVGLAKKQVEQLLPGTVKGFDELSHYGKANLDAMLTAGTIAARAFEQIGRELVAFNQEALEANMASARALFGAKDIQEALKLQGDLARQNLDRMIDRSTKISHLSLKLAGEAAEPINKRLGETVEGFVKPAAL